MYKSNKIKLPKKENSKIIREPKNDVNHEWYYSDERHFAFSFTKMPNSKYSIDNIANEDLVALVKKLKILCTQTWADLKRSGRHALGHEIIKKNALKVSLPNNISEDVKILAFRYSGKKPFLGYRRGKIFHIMYIDYNFSLYDH